MGKPAAVISIDVRANSGSLNSGLDESKRKFRELGEVGVSNMQATSAALRGIDFSSNIRAAERFISTIKGIGPIVQAAFPVFGALALVSVFVDLVKKVSELRDKYKELQEAPKAMGSEFERLHTSMALSNADLAVANDKLAIQIAKLEGKPQNGLKLSLDEAIASSMKLSESLQKNLAEMAKVLKEHQTGAMDWFVGNASNAGVSAQNEKFSAHLKGIERDGQKEITAAGSDPEALKAATDSLNQKRKEFIDLELQHIDFSIEEANREQGNRYLRSPLTGNIVGERGAWRDQTQNLASLGDYRDVVQAQSTAVDLETTHEKLTGRKDALEAGVNPNAAKRAELEAQAKQDLQRAATEVYGGVTRAAESFVSRMDALNKSGVASLKAVMDERGAFMLRLAGQTRGELKKDQDSNVAESGRGFGDSVSGLFKDATAANTFGAHAAQLSETENEKTLDYARQNVTQERDIRMSALDALNANTLQKKLQVEAAKFEIEKEYIAKIQDLELMRIDADAAKQRANEEETAASLIAKMGGDQSAIDKIKADLLVIEAGLDAAAARAKEAVKAANAAKVQVGTNTLASQTEKVPQTMGEGANAALKAFQAGIITSGQLVKNTLGGAITGVNDQLTKLVTGQKTSWGSLFQGLASQFASFALQVGESQLMKSLFGLGAGAGGQNTGGGLLSGLLKVLIPHAGGGSVDPGHGYIVGENGPEYFSPSGVGSIVPNKAMSAGAGGGSVAFYSIDARGADAEAINQRVSRALMAVHGSSVQQAVRASQELARRRPRGAM